MKRIGTYAGTFDPMTIGHADIIKRAINLVDELVVAVAEVNYKNVIFSSKERVEMTERYMQEFLPGKPIRVMPFSGLLVKFVESIGSNVVFRGIRAVSDFEHEFQLSCVNRRLSPEINTVFLPASENNQYISSRFVKEVARLGGDASSFSCKYIIDKLYKYYQNRPDQEQQITD